MQIGFALKARTNDSIPVDEKRERETEHAAIACADALVAHRHRVAERKPLYETACWSWIIVH